MADGLDPSASDVPDGHTVAGRIRALVEAAPYLEVAQFRFIGLDDIRQRYGDRWPARQARVQMVAREFISRRLRRGDVVVGGADGFLVIFADPDSDAARAASDAIAEALNTFFLGEEFGEALRCTARVNRMEAAALSRLADSIPARPAPKPAPRTRFLYQPVWAAAHEAITSYFVTPTDGRGRRAPGYHFDPLPPDAMPFPDIDELQLRESENGLQSLFKAGARALIGVTVHVSSFRLPNDRVRLLSAASSWDPRLKKYRVIRLAGIEPGYPRIQLEELVRLLRPHCAGIALNVHWSEPDISSILALKPATLGFPLHHDARGLLELTDTIRVRIRAAAAMARRAGIQVSANGDFSFAAARDLIADGVGHLSSQMIWPRLAQPCGMAAWPASGLSPR